MGISLACGHLNRTLTVGGALRCREGLCPSGAPNLFRVCILGARRWEEGGGSYYRVSQPIVLVAPGSQLGSPGAQQKFDGRRWRACCECHPTPPCWTKPRGSERLWKYQHPSTANWEVSNADFRNTIDNPFFYHICFACPDVPGPWEGVPLYSLRCEARVSACDGILRGGRLTGSVAVQSSG